MDVQIELKEFFQNSGYKVSLIGSNDMVKLLGDNVFPIFLDGNNQKYENKVNYLKSYIKQIEIDETPNLIVIGIPGGIMKYNDEQHNGYAYFSNLVGNVLTPDASILSVYAGEYPAHHIEELKKSCFYKFGISISHLHISEKVCDYNLESKRLDYFSVSSKYVVDNLLTHECKIPVFNVLDESSKFKCFNSIMVGLQNNMQSI